MIHENRVKPNQWSPPRPKKNRSQKQAQIAIAKNIQHQHHPSVVSRHEVSRQLQNISSKPRTQRSKNRATRSSVKFQFKIIWIVWRKSLEWKQIEYIIKKMIVYYWDKSNKLQLRHYTLPMYLLYQHISWILTAIFVNKISFRT